MAQGKFWPNRNSPFALTFSNLDESWIDRAREGGSGDF